MKFCSILKYIYMNFNLILLGTPLSHIPFPSNLNPLCALTSEMFVENVAVVKLSLIDWNLFVSFSSGEITSATSVRSCLIGDKSICSYCNQSESVLQGASHPYRYLFPLSPANYWSLNLVHCSFVLWHFIIPIRLFSFALFHARASWQTFPGVHCSLRMEFSRFLYFSFVLAFPRLCLFSHLFQELMTAQNLRLSIVF